MCCLLEIRKIGLILSDLLYFMHADADTKPSPNLEEGGPHISRKTQRPQIFQFAASLLRVQNVGFPSSLTSDTAANGSGTPYIPGAIFTIGTSSVTLYAVWTANPLHYDL
jgi:hypothetical protein